jgi:signal transduction histidine kinase
MHTSVAFTFGLWMSDVWLVVLVLLLVAFPSGRFVSPLDRLLVLATFIVVVPLEALWLSFLVFPPGVPANALLIHPDPDAASAVDWLQRGMICASLGVLSAVLARRWLRASRPLRRVLAPVLVGAVTVAVMALSYVLDKVGVAQPGVWDAALVLLAAIPLVFLAGLLRARLARSALGDMLVDLREAAEPGQLRDVLARALRDPTLELAFWVPGYGAYVGTRGEPVTLPAEGTHRVATLVERGGVPVAALVHDASLRDEPELVGAVTSAAGIALENERLQADLRARLAELRASRARIVEAGDTARRKLERDLHDGAQQRFVSLAIVLRLVAGKLPADSAEARLLETARAELGAGLEELRGLAQGIHPAVLSDHGLAVALESLIARAPLRVTLELGFAERLAEQVEAAAYFLVAEGLTNVAKYAEAGSAHVRLSHAGGVLLVEVGDDGRGGADPAGGSGLRGLADRVEALGGRLRVASPAGDGTRLRAEIPCA